MTARFSAVMVVFFAIAIVMVTAAQFYRGKFGTAHGVVVDASNGVVVADAEVELYAEYKKDKKTMKLLKAQKTRADGTFKFPATVSGTFRMTIKHPRYETLEQHGIVIEEEAKKDFGRIALTPVK